MRIFFPTGNDESYQEIAILLIKSGADLNATDFQDRTPLHTAAQNGKSKTIPQRMKKN